MAYKHGWAYTGGGGDEEGAYKRNTTNVSEQRDERYLRNELELTYQYI